ncbi:MAG: DNA cytosine methyltransferase [Ruminococcus sp.]|nr:DNA cytosine methyltransferase [Ruminococcus sp.]
MKVLSLFDRISCGMLALQRAGIDVEEYHAFEIDKYAIQVSERNFLEICIGNGWTVDIISHILEFIPA